MISPKCISLIRYYEGLKLQSYKCPAGVWTIGIGSTRYQGKPVVEGFVITESQAVDALMEELQATEKMVLKLIKVPIAQYQLDSILSFCYNLGVGNFKSSTLLKKINVKDFTGATGEFLKWNKCGGKVLDGLTKRRLAESILFSTGELKLV